MIVEFSILDTEDFTIEHIFDSSENEKLIFRIFCIERCGRFGKK